ncbi:hypothetical protein P3T76_008383 [Phytophthora citrophthora]|uniref:Uncharacterized protein n=1 Tax=Phytophthora citrophthora TaxID=4793 RepID=A0AAD9GKD9_9STRA|nr:hypothetical protein P3T76_008383 [Phytophthora citrophthora]
MDLRFDQHGSPNAIYHAGGVLDFIFGLELPPKEIHEAERMILVKLTELGFFWSIVTETGGRTRETFAFTEKSLRLIHDVVCALRCVFEPPTRRVVGDRPGSIVNPFDRLFAAEFLAPAQAQP